MRRGGGRGGVGARGLEIGGRFVNFTAIGVYLEEGALRSLAGKWGGAAAEELAGDEHFYRDIVAGEEFFLFCFCFRFFFLLFCRRGFCFWGGVVWEFQLGEEPHYMCVR